MTDTAPDPKRVRDFANFFKRYMSISSVVAAALPIPVAAFGLIPTFKSQAQFLSTYTPMLCFLFLGFFFYSRHHLARRMFPQVLGEEVSPSSLDANLRLYWIQTITGAVGKFVTHAYRVLSGAFVPLLPILLIAASVFCIFQYHFHLNEAVAKLRDLESPITVDAILKDTSFDLIWHGHYLAMYYIGIFVAAESAFIVMALKEYMQDLLGLSDMDILIGGGVRVSTPTESSGIESTRP